MSTSEAVRRMMGEAGMDKPTLSLSIGKNSTYIASLLWHDNTQKVSTLARIAHACGYRVMLVSDADEFEVCEGAVA